MITRSFDACITRTEDVLVTVPVQCTLTYDSTADPYVVQMDFELHGYGGRKISWVVDREFFNTARMSPHVQGVGDIKMQWSPARGVLTVCLENRDGHAHIALPSPEVSEFMMDSLNDTPLGDESADDAIDDAITRILDEG